MFDSDNYRRRKRRPRDQQQPTATTPQDPVTPETACQTDNEPYMTTGDDCAVAEDNKVERRCRKSLSFVDDDGDGDILGRPITTALKQNDVEPEVKDCGQCQVVFSPADVDTTDEREGSQQTLPADIQQPTKCVMMDSECDDSMPNCPRSEQLLCRRRPHISVTSSTAMSRKAKQFTIEQILGLNRDICS
jgi:hypothetical protein